MLALHREWQNAWDQAVVSCARPICYLQHTCLLRILQQRSSPDLLPCLNSPGATIRTGGRSSAISHDMQHDFGLDTVA